MRQKKMKNTPRGVAQRGEPERGEKGREERTRWVVIKIHFTLGALAVAEERR